MRFLGEVDPHVSRKNLVCLKIGDLDPSTGWSSSSEDDITGVYKTNVQKLMD